MPRPLHDSSHWPDAAAPSSRITLTASSRDPRICRVSARSVHLRTPRVLRETRGLVHIAQGPAHVARGRQTHGRRQRAGSGAGIPAPRRRRSRCTRVTFTFGVGRAATQRPVERSCSALIPDVVPPSMPSGRSNVVARTRIRFARARNAVWGVPAAHDSAGRVAAGSRRSLVRDCVREVRRLVPTACSSPALSIERRLQPRAFSGPCHEKAPSFVFLRGPVPVRDWSGRFPRRLPRSVSTP